MTAHYNTAKYLDREMEEGVKNRADSQATSKDAQKQPSGEPSPEAPKEVAKKARILDISQTPDWLVDNMFLLKGYRVGFERKRDIFKSLFMSHNELLNIWTHLLGGLIFLGVLIYVCLQLDSYLLLSKRLVFDEQSMNHIHKIFSEQELELGSKLDSNNESHFGFLEQMGVMRECISDYSHNFISECKENISSLKEFIEVQEEKLFLNALKPFFEKVACASPDRTRKLHTLFGGLADSAVPEYSDILSRLERDVPLDVPQEPDAHENPEQDRPGQHQHLDLRLDRVDPLLHLLLREDVLLHLLHHLDAQLLVRLRRLDAGLGL